MSTTGPDPLAAPVVRIAHAYGNSRAALEEALVSSADMIELDMWYRGGDLRVHHERKVRWLPLLIDRRMRTHKPGRFAVRIGNYYIRPDIAVMTIGEVFETVAGRKRLLLDVKGHYSAESLERYIEALVRNIRDHHAESWVTVCGQTYSVLHRLREVAPDVEVRFSIERDYQWARLLRMVELGHPPGGICMAYGYITDEKALYLESLGIDVYCWTVDDWAAAKRLISEGVDGIISNDLLLLATLREWPRGPKGATLRPGERLSESGAPPSP